MHLADSNSRSRLHRQLQQALRRSFDNHSTRAMGRDNTVRAPRTPYSTTRPSNTDHLLFQLDRLVGFSMLVLASTVFLYYTIWTLLLVRPALSSPSTSILRTSPQPFVAEDQPIRAFFPPQVWAIRIPVILLLMGGAVVGSFLSLVMIRSNRKKAAKAKAQKSK